MLSFNKDLAYSPFFGGIRRGFPKLLPRIGLKEFNNIFLRPKWYRLAKFKYYKKIMQKKADLFNFNAGVRNDFLFQKALNKKADIKFFFQFYIKKRWFLSGVLKND